MDRDQTTDETRLTYDADGLDKYGRPTPTHWSVLCPKSNPDEGPYGQRIVRLTGKLNTDNTGEEISDPGSSGASPPLLTMPGEDNQDEHGTDNLTLDTLPIAGPSATKVPASAKEVGVRRMRMARGMTVDSGAADNVMPRRMARGRWNKIRPSPGSRAGVHYVAADNARIKNEGECDFHFETKEGHKESYTFQIAEVNEALMAVSYLVDTGHQAIFDQDEATGVDAVRVWT